MPLVSEFFGIRVYMYWNDHMPPHFHAEYGGATALIDIKNAVVLRGMLPFRQLKLVLAWCELHEEEPMSHQVVQVIPREDYMIYVYFADGAIKKYSVRHLVGHGVFRALEDVDWYVDRCTVLNGTVAWDRSGRYDPRLHRSRSRRSLR